MPPKLTPSRWRTLEPIIDAALDLAREERGAYVRVACADDDSLRADVERLLAAHDGPDTKLDVPAARRFASLLDDGPPQMPPVVDQRYRIGPILGRGGMATVFLADDLRHERQVALKVLHVELAAALGVERFLAEIKTTAQLQHSHILPLHDSGDAGGILFYVMPYVPGGTLRQRLSQAEPISLAEVVQIASDVATALDAAHRRGVVHRDIKPENILLQDGAALVADFGIALALSAAASARSAIPRLIVGTPRYMSPEQAAADGAVDARADVYSLGVVVQEMLTSGGPMAAATPIPPAVASVVARAIASSPSDRYPSAGEFTAALALAAASGAGISKTAWWRKRGAALRVAGAAAAAVFLIVSGNAFVHRTVTVTPRQRTVNQKALDRYNVGSWWLDKRTPNGADSAERLFKEAIAADSNYSDAYSGLADVYLFYGIGNLGDYDPRQYFPRAKTAALRARSLDSTSARAHASVALVMIFDDHDWAGAERELKRSLELDPTYGPARTWNVVLLEFTAQFNDAVKEARMDVAFNPLSMLAATELGRALFLARDYDAAATQLRWTLARDSTQYRAHLVLGQVLEQQHEYESAISEMKTTVRLAPGSSRAHAYLANAYAVAGKPNDALQELRVLTDRAAHAYVPALDFAVVYAGLGKKDETFYWLGKALDDHSMRIYLQDATFDLIRSDPRYEVLLKRINLPYPA